MSLDHTCEHCKLHLSECVCETDFTIPFSYLEDGKENLITRREAHELRTEGLTYFRDDLEKYLMAAPKNLSGQTSSIYRWAMTVLEAAPLYFWVIPSSSSGKYHPAFSQGKQGLVKHTASVMYMANELSRTFNLNPVQTAEAVAAAAIHDICKYGLYYDPRYFGVHECLVRVKIGPKGANLLKNIDQGYSDVILSAVESHNGALVTGEWTAFRRPPEGPVAQVVHLADFTVSRKKFHYDI